ncbi:MAG: hypothetical protein ACLQOO_13235 [Terriglobia bacterium]
MRVRSVVFAVLLAAVGFPLVAAAGTDAKGIYVEKREIGVRFDVVLLRGPERRSVPTSYEFVSGDKMLFQFTVNRDAYVYVLTRTIPGDGVAVERFAGSKGIEVVQAEDLKAGRPTGEYRLLFPLKKTGLQNKLTADRVHTVPENGARFTMDQDPGIEKLYIVLSPDLIEMGKYFDLSTGRLAHPAADSRADPAMVSDLGHQMLEWSKNGDVAIPEAATKGITVEGYGVSTNSARPALVEIDLRHRRP